MPWTDTEIEIEITLFRVFCSWILVAAFVGTLFFMVHGVIHHKQMEGLARMSYLTDKEATHLKNLENWVKETMTDIAMINRQIKSLQEIIAKESKWFSQGDLW